MVFIRNMERSLNVYRKKPKTMKANRLIAGTTGLLCWLVCFDLRAIPTLTLTEISGTQLTWSWDGDGGGASRLSGALGTSFVTGDAWQGYIPFGIGIIPTGGYIPSIGGTWYQPSATKLNDVNGAYSGEIEGPAYGPVVNFTVFSGEPGGPGLPGVLADGDSVDYGTWSLRFVDLADTATLADSGSSGLLLALTAASLWLGMLSKGTIRTYAPLRRHRRP